MPVTNTTKSPLEVVKAFSTAMEQKDFDTGLKYVADNCEYTNGPMGTFRGPAGVRAVLEPFFAPILEQTFIIKREVANGPVVFLERLDRHLTIPRRREHVWFWSTSTAHALTESPNAW